MPRARSFALKYRVEAPAGLRYRLATWLVGLVVLIFRVKIRCYADDRQETRSAEAEANRDIIRIVDR